MAYGYRRKSYAGRSRYSRRTTRYSRRSGRYRRSRYTRRTRSTVNYSRQGGRVISRQTQVKLPWSETITSNIPNGTDSISYWWLGNSLFPASSSSSSSFAQPGDTWAAGVSQYMGFYRRYRVDASSIKINLVNRTPGAFLKCVLLSTPLSKPLNEMIPELDALSYEDLMSWQYASWKSATGAGNNQSIWFNKFRKTKHMLSYRNASDNQEVEFSLPDPDGTDGTRPTNPNTGYLYYLRMFNQTGTQPSILAYDMTVKMILYTTLLSPTLRTQLVVPEP